MRSLRGRLVAILLLVASIGLVVLAAVTYSEQRSFLYERVDRQVTQGFVGVSAALSFEDNLRNRLNKLDDSSGRRSGSDNLGPTGSGALGRFDDDDLRKREDERGGGEKRGGGAEDRRAVPLPPAGAPGFNLPPGTYGALIDEDGKVVGSRLISLDSSSPALPDLNFEKLGRRPQTVGAEGASGLQYRAASAALPDGHSVVVAIPLADTEQTLNRLLLVEVIVVLAVLLLLGIVSWLLVGIGLRPLNRMGETADAIAGGDLSHRVEPADEHSEIGRLGLALNRMLHRLEEAFDERKASEDRLRQFLADASHELRTPLASIRGYAELHRMGATPDPAEVERSMDRIEQESERMGVLVEDMLALARLEETHQHNYAPVDFAEIARNAVDDAHAIAPQREITIDASSPASVTGNAHQLKQVVTNLLGNAISHTPDGTAIEVTLANDGDDLRLDVRDNGNGLPNGGSDQIFERFWRAETGRERGKAGSGLGLAIVAGIVDAHQGRVDARNAAEGTGAVFSVWLPRLDSNARSVRTQA